MALGLLGFGLVFLLLASNLGLVKMIKKKRWLFYFLIFFFVFAFAISLRVFVIEMYKIPSGSMENTLATGDMILVSKLNYGPRLPKALFEIPWLNTFNTTGKSYINDYGVNSKDRRLKGFSKVTNNEVVVFEHPREPGNYLAKRCVGIPGDSLSILDGFVHINGVEIDKSKSLKRKYRVWTKNNLSHCEKKNPNTSILNLSFYDILRKKLEINITNDYHRLLENLHLFDSITLIDTPIETDPNGKINWSLHNWEATVVPHKNQKIILDANN